jgi:hypothetical protein
MAQIAASDGKIGTERARIRATGAARLRDHLRLDSQDTAADQVCEPLPLFGGQKRMDFLKGPGERLAQARRTPDPALTGAGGLGGVECLAGYGVGKLSQRSPIIHLGLSALGLDIIQDPHQRGDLLLVQVELVCEKPQRASDTEGRAALEPIGLAMLVGHEAPAALAPIATGGAPKLLVLLQPIRITKKGGAFELTRRASRGMTHGSLLLARALRSRRGKNAWALCRTLTIIVRRYPALIKLRHEQLGITVGSSSQMLTRVLRFPVRTGNR